ncbi:hypothetical protein F7U82_23325 [Vibrio parahaemolyticus]|nr:hypothetical protein [Vibrio parahaemolyticus]
MMGYRDLKTSLLSSIEHNERNQENFQEKESFTKILSQLEMSSKSTEEKSLLEAEEETIKEDEENRSLFVVEDIVGRDCLNFVLTNPHRNQHLEIKTNEFLAELEAIKISWFRDYNWYNGFYPLSLFNAKLDRKKVCSSEPFECNFIGYSESQRFTIWGSVYLNLDRNENIKNVTDVYGKIPDDTNKYYDVENYILSDLVLDSYLKSGLKLDGEYFKDGSNLVKYRVFFKRKYYFFTFESGRLIDYLEEGHDGS